MTGFGFPVVPEGTARIRVQMSAALEREHLDRRWRRSNESAASSVCCRSRHAKVTGGNPR